MKLYPKAAAARKFRVEIRRAEKDLRHHVHPTSAVPARSADSASRAAPLRPLRLPACQPRTVFRLRAAPAGPGLQCRAFREAAASNHTVQRIRQPQLSLLLPHQLRPESGAGRQSERHWPRGGAETGQCQSGLWQWLCRRFRRQRLRFHRLRPVRRQCLSPVPCGWRPDAESLRR